MKNITLVLSFFILSGKLYSNDFVDWSKSEKMVSKFINVIKSGKVSEVLPFLPKFIHTSDCRIEKGVDPPGGEIYDYIESTKFSPKKNIPLRIYPIQRNRLPFMEFIFKARQGTRLVLKDKKGVVFSGFSSEIYPHANIPDPIIRFDFESNLLVYCSGEHALGASKFSPKK